MRVRTREVCVWEKGRKDQKKREKRKTQKNALCCFVLLCVGAPWEETFPGGTGLLGPV
jgi:hypothetical protein